MRPFSELSDSGLLWLINRVVFHPRGLALAVHVDDAGAVEGWSLQGDGSEAWSFPPEAEQDLFRLAEQTLTAARAAVLPLIPADGVAIRPGDAVLVRDGDRELVFDPADVTVVRPGSGS